MKIYFSPSYTSRVHISHPLMMDSTICNVPQLVDLVELHSGVHYKEYSQAELCVRYMQALLTMDTENSKNVLHESLAKDPISTAQACLCWRDMLILAGWSPEMCPSERIRALALAEPHFSARTLADRIIKLPELIAKSGLAKRLEIEVQYDERLMHPAVTAIIGSLRDNGAVITYPVDGCAPCDSNLSRISDWMLGLAEMPEIVANDGSIEILKFKNRKSLLRHITSLPEDTVSQSLWISDHGADIDRALRRGGKYTSGSNSDGSLPSIVQLLPLGIGMFISPVDINKLVAWLRASRSPLPGVRYSIANVILNEGGWDDDKVANAVDTYIAKHPEMDEKEIRKTLKNYLRVPDANAEASVKQFKAFINNMKKWAQNAKKQEYQHAFFCQYDALIDRISTVEVLIDTHSGETIDAATLSQWSSMACEDGSYEQYPAHCMGPVVINSPADMVGNHDTCHWIGFTDYTPCQKSYSFLSSGESAALSEMGCRLYAEDMEMAAHRTVSLWPLRHVRHITVCEMKDKEPDEIRSVVSQQLLSMPESSLKRITTEMPDTPGKEPSNTISHYGDYATRQISISNGASMEWLEEESYSSINTLVQHPLEYVLKYGLKLEPSPDDTISVSKSTGNVAHYVIESLFAPGRKAAQIRAHYDKEYDDLFDKALHQKGMILMLPENRIEQIRLRNNLRASILRLIDIYEANGFVTVACEEMVKDVLTPPDGLRMKAYLDMHVVDNNGVHAVIDLKWTSSPKTYESKVKNEMALQLDIYHTLLATMHSEVKSAYYVMPRNRLYTYYDFRGDAVEHVATDHNVKDVIARLINSYNYRRNQIVNGEIEMANGAKIDEFAYGKDCKSGAELYPLEVVKSRKCENKFSDYKCFYK